MCGIYGQLGKLDVDEARAQAATDRLRHRGPDERGAWCGGPVFLGMRRLSIIDLAGGQQPVWNEDRTCCIVFNGEIYNFLGLLPRCDLHSLHALHSHLAKPIHQLGISHF